ncbi:uncharacterized protein LOC115634263 [Scaptodrosophila lebanonensis]|uniref:Uncharacterized protein LOC115634263 n=1 Tax=Drosophila lebanonensis TaxID=7225 RepID=A0A6J2UHA6_DROLE|nr:uncharacterized protein LOC115634263 [Scaptodrosophila lebanonensis]
MSDVEKAIKGDPHEDDEDNGHAADDESQQIAKSVKVLPAPAASTIPASRPQRCFSLLLKLLCSTPGLVFLVIGYSVLGALIFPLFESPQDLSKSAVIAKSREDCLRELWTITEKLNVLYERNWTMLVHEQLRRFEGSIVAATRQGGSTAASTYSGLSANALGHFGYDAAASGERWTFSEALLYSVTVITTIGHGSLTPRTAAGKLATIFYALIGVPLMLMCLSSLGALLAEALQCTYVRLCCHLQRAHAKEKTQDLATAKGRQTASHGGSCKSCKYDVANSETSLNECYEYGHTNILSKRKLSLEQTEDCQLLSNAATSKFQLQQHYQQQQQRCQLPQQQQPDVMLMATTTTENAMLKYAPSPPPSQQQHALHYINSQQQQQLSTATLPRAQHPQQQQHRPNFVAVPSSMLRFNVAGPTGPSEATPHAPPNCYRSATATIYFPFAPASGTDIPAHGSHLTAASAGAHCQQPLVKYHTIHLQPSAKRLLTALEPVVVTASTVKADAQAEASPMSTLETITLPPPPAYQTANVNAVRCAKFVTKPLPHNTNSLLAGGAPDISCRHDLFTHALTTTATTTTASAMASVTGSTVASSGVGAATRSTATPPLLTFSAATSPQLSACIKATTAATMADNSLMAAGVCSSAAMTSTTAIGPRATATAAATATTSGRAAAALSALLSSTGNVDIMEDEDEHDRERLSNCPHGTPSRVPLIASSAASLVVPHSSALAAAERSGSQARSLLNATAASFHRHTLQPLNRKTLLLTRRCQKHATLYDPTSTTEGSEDEECGAGEEAGSSADATCLQHGSEQFVLKKLSASQRSSHMGDTDDCDDDDNERCEPYEHLGVHPVPISVVLLILMCYLCVGTFFFALWENWSLVDGAYFCFVTLSTIGYGDIVPTRSFNGPEVQLYACCAYLLLGLVLVAMSFSILETQLMWKCKRIAVRLKLAKN